MKFMLTRTACILNMQSIEIAYFAISKTFVIDCIRVLLDSIDAGYRSRAYRCIDRRRHMKVMHIDVAVMV